MAGELYEYQGQKVTLTKIAQLNQLSVKAFLNHYRKTQDVEASIKLSKLKQLQLIEYQGKLMSLYGIAQLNQVKFTTLKKYYLASGDINQAVTQAALSKERHQGVYEYQGKMMSVNEISQLVNLHEDSIRKYLKLTNNDMNQAVAMGLDSKAKQTGDILYHGQIRTVNAIAMLENLNERTLRKYYLMYGNIEKAVLIVKQIQKRRHPVTWHGEQTSYGELSKYFGISVMELEKRLAHGDTPEQIEQTLRVGVPWSKHLRVDETSLHQYCLDHSYNYNVILHLIRTYGKTPESAIATYVKNGQQIPTKWIYEKYQVLFRHLMLSMGVDSDRIVKIMKKKRCNIQMALEEYVFVHNNQNQNFQPAEIDWLQECYRFLEGLEPQEIPVAQKELYLDEREMAFIQRKGARVQQIKRQLLLFEFAEVMDQWPADELNAMMEAYAITPAEKHTIQHDLYRAFTGKVINPKKLTTLNLGAQPSVALATNLNKIDGQGK